MKRIVISALYLLILFLISRFIFEPTHLYYEIKWLDIPMHVLGGIGVASLGYGIVSYAGKNPTFWRIFIFYTIVAIAWELYEYSRDLLNDQPWNGWLDTTSDFLNGAIGAIIAYRLIRK